MPALPVSPVLRHPHTMRLFRHYCQKVLPAVFDDSLSYYELLCKLSAFVNKLAESNEGLDEDLEDIKETIDGILEYIKQIEDIWAEINEMKIAMCALAQNALVYDVTTGTYRASISASRRMFQALRFDGMTVADLATYTVADAAELNVRHIAVDGRVYYMDAGLYEDGIPRQQGYECAHFNPDEYIKKSQLTYVESDNLQDHTIMGILDKDAASELVTPAPYVRRYTVDDLNRSWVMTNDHVLADYDGEGLGEGV